MARVIAKEVPNLILYDDGVMRVANVRASYPHLFEPYAGEDGDEKSAAYGIVGLLNKTTHMQAVKLIVEQIDKTLKEAKQPTGKGFPADKKFLRDGDSSGKENNFGCFTLSAREKRKPIILDARKRVVEEDDGMFFGGMYVNLLFRPWWQSNKYGKRVNANLIGVQFHKTGDAFGEGRIAEEDVVDAFEAGGDDGEDAWGDDAADGL